MPRHGSVRQKRGGVVSTLATAAVLVGVTLAYPAGMGMHGSGSAVPAGAGGPVIANCSDLYPTCRKEAL